MNEHGAGLRAAGAPMAADQLLEGCHLAGVVLQQAHDNDVAYVVAAGVLQQVSRDLLP